MIVDGYVDAAGIGRRLFILPGEVSFFFLSTGEVSRGIITFSNELVPLKSNTGGLTKQRRAKR
jgi:hypothetical protein